MIPEQVELFLSNQVEALQKTLSKAVLGLATLVVPLLLLWSGLSTGNKIIGSILWVSIVLNSFLICKACSHRIEIKRLKSDLSKKPTLKELPPEYRIDKRSGIAIRILDDVPFCSSCLLNYMTSSELIKRGNETIGISYECMNKKCGQTYYEHK